MKISEKLKKIPGAKQYGSYDNPEPEGGVQRYWSKESNAPVHPTIQTRTAAPTGPGAAMARRRRRPVRPARTSVDGSPRGRRPAATGRRWTAAPQPAPREHAKQRARIIFRVEPGDAAVYLNDHFVGTGEELSTLTRGLQVRSGPAHDRRCRGRAW